MGKYQHGKQKRPIDYEVFANIMEKGYFAKPKTHKSFLAFLYYTGVRVSEALELTKENFTITDSALIVEVPAKKRGIERGPFELSRNLPYVELIIEQVRKTRRSKSNPKGKVWNISRTTAWRIVKRVMPKHYPHFFRLNRCVHFLSTPGISLEEVRNWFAWRRMETLNEYLGIVSIQKLSKKLEKSI